MPEKNSKKEVNQSRIIKQLLIICADNFLKYNF